MIGSLSVEGITETRHSEVSPRIVTFLAMVMKSLSVEGVEAQTPEILR